MDFFYHTIMLRKIQVGGIFLWNRKKDYPDNTDGGISRPFDRTAGGYGTFEKYSSHRFCGQFPPDYLGNALRACFGLYGCRTFPGAGKISGDSPLWALIPFIIAGNITICAVWYLIAGRGGRTGVFRKCLAVAGGAAAKTAVLYGGIACFAVPYLLVLAEPQASLVSGMFSLPQFITAMAGGTAAAVLLPVLRKAVKEI